MSKSNLKEIEISGETSGEEIKKEKVEIKEEKKMNDEKRLEIQEEEMDFIEKCVEEAPTSELSNTGIEVDGKGDEE